MMPAELKSLYRCLLKRQDTVISCTQENNNEFHIAISTDVLLTIGPKKGTFQSNLLSIHLSPRLTGDGWNNNPSK